MSKLQPLCVVTGNKNKAAEISAITGRDIEAVDLDLREIQSLSVEEVARDKALQAYELTGKPVVVDDTGMTIAALGGLPGALVSWFLDTLGPDGLLKLVPPGADRSASVLTCIGYADQHGVETFIGQVLGSLPEVPRGTEGFGYDPIFIPEGSTKTYAEMTAEEKNSVSMRKRALVQLSQFLNTR